MPMTRMRLLCAALVAAALSWSGMATRAEAHPHIWITVQTVVVYEKGAFVGVRHTWTFDEYYSSMAIEGLDKNKDGVYDREELAELAKVNVDGLKEFAYFTFPALAGQPLKVGDASDYWLEHKGGLLALHFTLPFEKPVLAEAKGLIIAIHDPSFFIAFEPAKIDPVKLSEGAPKGCEAKIGPPPILKSGAPGTKLEEMQAQIAALGGNPARVILVECGGP
jgi:ABC-type uncharacterized transport system substrate-binding protein